MGTADRALVRMTRSFGASPATMLRTVVLPGLFAIVVLLAATATALNEAMLRLESRLLRWRPESLSGPRASSA